MAKLRVVPSAHEGGPEEAEAGVGTPAEAAVAAQ